MMIFQTLYKRNQPAVTSGEVGRVRPELRIKPTPLHIISQCSETFKASFHTLSFLPIPVDFGALFNKKPWRNGKCSRGFFSGFFAPKAWRSFLLPESSPMPAAKAGSATLEVSWNAQHATGTSKEKTWLKTAGLDLWFFDTCVGNRSICLVFQFCRQSV